MKKAITAERAPAAIGPYSHGVAVGDLFFTSGQIPLVPETGKLVEGPIEAQAEQVLRVCHPVPGASACPLLCTSGCFACRSQTGNRTGSCPISKRTKNSPLEKVLTSRAGCLAFRLPWDGPCYKHLSTFD